MELYSLKSITLDDTTKSLIDDAIELARNIDEIRPLPEDVLKTVKMKLLGDRIYNSNAIEGNLLTLRETVAILQAGADVTLRRKREADEVIGMKNAIDRIQQLVVSDMEWCSPNDFMSVHGTLMAASPEISGRLRSERVMLTGAKHQPPSDLQIPELLNEFFSQLATGDEFDPVQVATWAHWCIARIHPFMDGNGRMSRLWQDLVLFRRKLASAIIRPEDRAEYYRALTAADDGDFNSLAQLIAQRLLSTLQIYISARDEADSVRDWAADLVGEVSARAASQRKLEYMRWKHRMEMLLDAFVRCAIQVTNASAGVVEIQVIPYPIIDQSAWESLRAGSGAKQTWFFKLNCRRDKTMLRYFFFFGKHFWGIEDDVLGGIGPSVCLLISEYDAKNQNKEDALRLDEIAGTPLTLRELLVVGEGLTRKRVDMITGKAVYDTDIEPIHVAQQFVKDVLLSRLT